MEIIKLRDDFIKLGQALKAAGLVESGVEAKEFIVQGLVVVNGEVETRRGRKLYDGDEVEFDGERYVYRIYRTKQLQKLQKSKGRIWKKYKYTLRQ